VQLNLGEFWPAFTSDKITFFVVIGVFDTGDNNLHDVVVKIKHLYLNLCPLPKHFHFTNFSSSAAGA